MNRIATFVSRVALFAIPLGALATASAPRDATAQYIAPPPPQNYIAPPPPPDAYVATAQPEYFEGRPVYLYNGSWYYRDERGGWNYYRNEPPYLRDRRAHWNAPDRRYHYRR
jgi:hypothetical protein